ncbi:unnamed protein product [Ectocarpus sp. 8 AP-2014]
MLLVKLECCCWVVAPPCLTWSVLVFPISQSCNRTIVQSSKCVTKQPNNQTTKQPNSHTANQPNTRSLAAYPVWRSCYVHAMSTVICHSPPACPLHPCLSTNNAGVMKKCSRTWEPTAVGMIRKVHLNRTSNRVEIVYENDWLWIRTVDSANRAIVVSSVLDDWCTFQVFRKVSNGCIQEVYGECEAGVHHLHT